MSAATLVSKPSSPARDERGDPDLRRGAGVPWQDRPSAGAWLAVILGLVAGVVFVTGIQTPWPWSDEGATYLALQRDWGQLLVLWRSPDAPMVPYYLAAKGWVTALQSAFPHVSVLVALRLFSAAAATATVLVLYALVARNAGRIAGLVAGSVLISLPGFDRYAQEARSYALLALLATTSWLAYDRWTDPGRKPTLTGSYRCPDGARRRERHSTWLAAAWYAISLAAVAAVHTFGLFQWPAHALAAMLTPGTARQRWRRTGALMMILLTAAGLAAVQLVPSVSFGTGPRGLRAARIVTPTYLILQFARAISSAAHSLAWVSVIALAVTGVLLAARRYKPGFVVGLLTWMGLPLVCAMVIGSVRTNLFRIRYWIAFLPPLAALAALGVVSLAVAAIGTVQRRPGGTARPDRPRFIGWAIISAVVVAGQALAMLPMQVQIRVAGGHGENLGSVLAVVAAARVKYPHLTVVISDHSASGIMSATEPGLERENPLLRLDPSRPTVYTTPTPVRASRRRLASADFVLWIYRGAVSAKAARARMPRALAGLHPRLVRRTPAGHGWTALVFALR